MKIRAAYVTTLWIRMNNKLLNMWMLILFVRLSFLNLTFQSAQNPEGM